MKLVRMLILALGLVTLATASSFAAVAFSTTATVNMMNMDAQTGLIGSVLYTPMGTGGTVTAGEIISLNLPTNVPISYLPDITVSITGTTTSAFAETFGATVSGTAPNGKTWVNVSGGTAGSAIGTATGQFTGYGDTRTATTANFSGASVQVNQNSLVISFGSSITFLAIDFIKIDGVRVDVTSMAQGGGYLTASLTNTTGQATTDTPQVTVATFVPEANIFTITSITGVANTAGGAGLKFYTNGVPYDTVTGPIAGPQNKVTVTLKELFPNAWETKTIGGTYTANQYTRIKLSFPNLPSALAITGVSLEGPDGATFTNGQYQSYNYFTYGWTTPAITVNPTEIGIVSQSPNKLESLRVGLTFGLASGNTFPLNTSPVTIQAVLDNPATWSLPYSYTPSSYGVPTYPQNQELHYKAPALGYNATATMPLTLVPVATNLLSTFNAYMKNTDGTTSYDTGIAITNLSGTNPTTASASTIGTVGNIVATLYPFNGGTPIIVDTATLTDNNMKKGMDLTSGTLPPAQSWKVMLSQLLKAGGWDMTKEFSGMIRFKCNFQEASGVVFVYNINYLGDGNVNSFVGYQMYTDTPTNLTITGTTGTSIPGVF